MSEYYREVEAAEAYDSEPFFPEGDIDFYVELAREVGGSVLEIGCGTGRVTIPIAQQGVEIVGMDNSAAMLDVARRKADGVDGVSWVQADMRDFELGRRFDLVIIPFRSFLVLYTTEEQKACLARIREHLGPGGRLALNFFQPDIGIIADWQGPRSGSLQRLAVVTDPATGRRRQFWQTNRYDTASQEVFHTRVTEELDAEGRATSTTYRELRLRYIHRFEMEHLLALSGFEVEVLYGWFDKSPFDAQSGELIWVARKA